MKYFAVIFIFGVALIGFVTPAEEKKGPKVTDKVSSVVITLILR